jgi:hypothetical protein
MLARSGNTWVPGGRPPVPEPARRLVFCEGWSGHSPRYSHAALWARGPAPLLLSSRRPVSTSISVDGVPVVSRRVTRPILLRVGGPGWHLVGVDVRSAAAGLRVTTR